MKIKYLVCGIAAVGGTLVVFAVSAVVLLMMVSGGG